MHCSIPKRKNISKKVRFEVLKRDNFTCQYCGATAPDSTMHLDHIMPHSKGGTNSPSNLITACIDCNIGKGNNPLDSRINGNVVKVSHNCKKAALRSARKRFSVDNEEEFYRAYNDLLSMELSISEILANLEESNSLGSFVDKARYYKEEVFV